jgi:hypothetical protein
MLLAFADGAGLRKSGPPTTGLQLWFKADAGVTTFGSLVTGWADISGNGYNASQPTTALQPTLLTGGSGINGLPAIRFNNTGGNHLSCYLTTTFNPSAWAGLTVLYVNRTSTTLVGAGGQEAYDCIFGWQQASVSWIACNAGNNSDPTQALGWGGTNGAISLGATAGIGNSQLVIEAYRYDKAHWSMSGTFTSGPVADTAFPTASITAWLGTNSYPGSQNTGDIAEILVYDHKLSDADLAAAMSYLTHRYT